MKAHELRSCYLNFFADRYEHSKIKGASLIPENDPTVLFTTAGMHPLVPYLMGEKHPAGTRLVNVQKCIRTGDIEEVGDNTHLTFFEMLGNWSLGDYFKDLSIKMSFEFLTNSRENGGLGLGLENLAFTCFEGDKNAPKDEESAEIWMSLGVSSDRIAFLSKADNWWGPAGQTGPCGPDTEIFYWSGDGHAPDVYDPNDERWVEIWNNVFMQYDKKENGSFDVLKQKNVDTGMGLERVISLLNGKKSPFETDLFADVISEIRMMAGYDVPDEKQLISERVIADHLRTATFILGDPCAVTPSNTDQGYVLRRLIRRAIGHAKNLGIELDIARKIVGMYVDIYGDFYTELVENKERIFEEIVKEEKQFKQTLNKGLSLLTKQISKLGDSVDIKSFPEDFFFDMFATYGFPIEMTMEGLAANDLINDDNDKKYVEDVFDKYFAEHQKLSKSASDKKFSGGLADNSEEVTRLHTATHLLHQALRTVLGDHVAQRGSNINKDRLRFDFSHPAKMTPEEKAEVEALVNEQIKASLPITCEEMSVEEAKSKGAIGLFGSKYGEVVKVYTIGNADNFFSMEICGGPHVSNTSELVSFKIKKEESSSSGVRRIKAVLGV